MKISSKKVKVVILILNTCQNYIVKYKSYNIWKKYYNTYEIIPFKVYHRIALNFHLEFIDYFSNNSDFA